MADRPRTVVWFSCGAPSAVAAKLVAQEQPDCVLAYCDTGGEHEDNARFLKDVARWCKKDITILKSPRYKDHFDVFRQRRFLAGPHGAPCTEALKRRLRELFQRPDDVHVWGFTAEERARADDFEERNAGLTCRWPLIEANLTRDDCLALLHANGIDIPAMYKLGYKNNNCIGCVKGGAGYWNKIRQDFPGHFAEMAKVEREIGHAILKRNGVPLYLDELPENMGRYEAEPDLACGFICQIAQLGIIERDAACSL